jgi:hypothetical protein
MAKAKKKSAKKATKKKRTGKLHLPASRTMRPAGLPPEGCIGPPDPIPLFSDAKMAKIVRDCAGIPLDKDVVERLTYMMRRAHGIGMMEGSKKNPAPVPEYVGRGT